MTTAGLASVGPRACVIGDPIAHSRSPLIHGFWLAALGINGSYTREHVTAYGLPGFITRLRRGEYVGANVTVPHKEAVCGLVDRLDQAAKAIGAINTLWMESGRLVGGNTDAIGFLGNLDQQAPGWDADLGCAVVIGAGGAARAVVWALAQRKIGDVRIANRNIDRAIALSEDIAGPVRAHGLDDLPTLIPAAELIINASSLGMTGKPPLRIDLAEAPKSCVVNDLVYAPLETDLLKRARARDLIAVDGLGMLLHQAAPGFEKWFGQRPEVTKALRDHVIADLTGQA